MNPLIIEILYQTPVSKVWNALSVNSEMKHWYFDIKEFKTEIGFEFDFIGGTEEKPYKHFCKIIELIPLQKLSYSWRYEGYQGNSVVQFELTGEGTHTKLILTHQGLESFPSDNPDLKRDNFVQGWTELLGTSLKNYLESTPNFS